MKLIDKDALVAEIEKLEKALKNACKPNPFGNTEECMTAAELQALDVVKETINTLEVKEVDDELQGIEKEIAEDSVNAIDRKHIPIVLKGEIKAKFKNEFNTLWQTVGGIQFANVAKHIIERLCLHFAAWGAYNLKGYCSISSEEKHKMDIEVKEIDFEKELDSMIVPELKKHKALPSLMETAKHFFELGLKAQKGK